TARVRKPRDLPDVLHGLRLPLQADLVEQQRERFSGACRAPWYRRSAQLLAVGADRVSGLSSHSPTGWVMAALIATCSIRRACAGVTSSRQPSCSVRSSCNEQPILGPATSDARPWGHGEVAAANRPRTRTGAQHP